MHPYALLALSGISLALWVLLLMVEAHSGVRRLSRIREALDRLVQSGEARLAAHMPHFDRYYFKQTFHYVVHLLLSALLWSVGHVERGIKRIAHLNRSRARVIREPKSDSHLGKVLAHKEEIALSDEEKEVRKDAALRGSNEG